MISEYENALKYIIIADEIDPKHGPTLFLYFLILLTMNTNEKCKIILQKIKSISKENYNFGLVVLLGVDTKHYCLCQPNEKQYFRCFGLGVYQWVDTSPYSYL